MSHEQPFVRHRTAATRLRRLAWMTLGIGAIHAEMVAQSGLQKEGSEYFLAPSVAGDQVRPSVSFGNGSGLVAWQDYATDGDGFGISARWITRNLTGTQAAFRVNSTSQGDQENVKVLCLTQGGAALVWQGGARGSQRIFARFVGADGKFTTEEFPVSPAGHSDAVEPVVAQLKDGNLIIAWSAHGADSDMLGVAFQKVSPKGEKMGQVGTANQATPYNQRNVAIACTSTGGFALAWISEQQRFENSVDLYARTFGPEGVAMGDEFLVNENDELCSLPALVGTPDGVVAGWSQRHPQDAAKHSWDVLVRGLNNDGSPKNPATVASEYTELQQYGIRFACAADKILATWISNHQDGDQEGVFAREVSLSGTPQSSELAINTTTVSKQIDADVLADSNGKFVVIWSTFANAESGFDVAAQKVAPATAALVAPGRPTATAISASRVSVTWAPMGGTTVQQYELAFDDESVVATTQIVWQNSKGLGSSTQHTVKVRYVLPDGRKSPWSEPASVTTWGEDENADGLPDDWQQKYFGVDAAKWPGGIDDSDGDGISNSREFLSGTLPTDPSSNFKTSIEKITESGVLHWNCQPGFVYQVETSSDMKQWTKLGDPRFATHSADSLQVIPSGTGAFYRVIRLR